jgi:hypothetical protein
MLPMESIQKEGRRRKLRLRRRVCEVRESGMRGRRK